jgi:hypothetical protein
MHDTQFLRSDELPGRAALGYLAVDGLRTNVFHLPVRGSGDGGVYSTAADIRSMWTALFAGRFQGFGGLSDDSAAADSFLWWPRSTWWTVRPAEEADRDEAGREKRADRP